MDYSSNAIDLLESYNEMADEIGLQADWQTEVGHQLYLYIKEAKEQRKSVTMSVFAKRIDKFAKSYFEG